jgi:predicted dehydrogenase
VKVGILGYGYMGTIRHRALAARSDFEVTRIFHTDASAPLHAAAWQDVVDDPAIDAVIVCLPNHLLAEATLRALAAGKHVLAEKPPGISAREARAMRDAAGGRVLQFGFNLRHHPAIRRARSLVASGQLGMLVWMRGVYGKPMADDFASGWRADPASAGGGILLDQGIHLLDVIHLLGGPFDDVHAVASTREGARVEDDVMITMRAAHGPIASLHSSHRQSPPRFSLELGFSDGAARLEGLLTRTGRYGPERIAWGPLSAPLANEEVFATDDSWAREIDAFVTAIRSGTTPSDGSPDQAVALMELVDLVYARAGLAPR